MPAQSAPQRAPAIVAKRMWSSGFIPANEEPIQTASTAPDDVLARAADVEEAAAEGERDGEAREDQRRRRDQRLLHVQRRQAALVAGHPREEPVEARPVEDRPVGRERVLPRRDEDDEAADQECEHCGQHRREQPARLLRDVVAAEQRLPHLRHPRGSGGASVAGPARSRFPLRRRQSRHLRSLPASVEPTAHATPPSRARRPSWRRRAPPPSHPAGTRRRSRPRT